MSILDENLQFFQLLKEHIKELCTLFGREWELFSQKLQDILDNVAQIKDQNHLALYIDEILNICQNTPANDFIYELLIRSSEESYYLENTRFRQNPSENPKQTEESKQKSVLECQLSVLTDMVIALQQQLKVMPSAIIGTSKKILILSCNPHDTARLRLNEEVREIEEGLLRSKYRDYFLIYSRLAVRLRDFRRALLDYEPQIVHFCGHGEESGLMVEDKNGNAILFTQDAVARLFECFTNHVECVLLNACYSEKQAEAIVCHINYVIGMQQAIGDKAAIEFSVGFYDALGAGKTVEEAFKFGCNAIPEHLTPVLKKKPCGSMNP